MKFPLGRKSPWGWVGERSHWQVLEILDTVGEPVRMVRKIRGSHARNGRVTDGGCVAVHIELDMNFGSSGLFLRLQGLGATSCLHDGLVLWFRYTGCRLHLLRSGPSSSKSRNPLGLYWCIGALLLNSCYTTGLWTTFWPRYMKGTLRIPTSQTRDVRAFSDGVRSL